MEKADIVWGGKACWVVQALSLADGGRIRARAVNEDPDDVTTWSYVSAARVSNKSQAFYLAGLSKTTHGAQFAFSRFGIRSETPQENLHFFHGLQISGLETQGYTIFIGTSGLVLTAQLLQGFAQLTVCRSVVGVDADGLFKALDGVREAAAF